MTDFTLTLRRYALDAVVIVLTCAAALACWIYQMPLWMLVICLVVLVFAVISLLGDMGVFGGQSD